MTFQIREIIVQMKNLKICLSAQNMWLLVVFDEILEILRSGSASVSTFLLVIQKTTSIHPVSPNLLRKKPNCVRKTRYYLVYVPPPFQPWFPFRFTPRIPEVNFFLRHDLNIWKLTISSMAVSITHFSVVYQQLWISFECSVSHSKMHETSYA